MALEDAMLNVDIRSGNPKVVELRIDDRSVKPKLYESPPRAINVPIIFNWFEYGPLEANLVYGNSIALTYGEESNNLRGKFATHVTPFLNQFLQDANPVVIKRLVPSDIGPKASLRIEVEVLEESLDEYEREVDGSFRIDGHGDFVTTGRKVKGHLIKFHKKVIPNDPVDGLKIGKGSVRTGTLQNQAGEFSKIYPLWDFVAPHYGSRGNQFALRMWSPTTKDSTPLKDNILQKDNCFPYRLSLMERKNEKSSSHEVANFFGQKSSDFVIKPDMVDTDYVAERSFEYIAVTSYEDSSPKEGYPKKYGPIGEMYSYADNIEVVLKAIMTEEAKQHYMQNDLYDKEVDTEEELFYRVNILSLNNADGSPYQTARFDSSLDGIRFGKLTDHYLDGATDGTMTDAELAKLVENELDEFHDPQSRYQDIVQYPCTSFWDSGFPLSTKFKMGYFISQRSNTMVYISTYVAGERPLTIQEEISRGIAIVERLRTFAESDYFSTKTCRANVMCSSATLINSSYRKRVPVNIELAHQVALMAGGQSFKKQFVFDRPPVSVFKLTSNVSEVWAPPSANERRWDIGLMWPDKLSTREIYFPATRSVYADDTSVLMGLINMIILAECETIGKLAHKRFSGRYERRESFSNDVEEWVKFMLEGRFAGLCAIEPVCYFTLADRARGYSWTLKIKVWLNKMRTVEVLTIEAHDIEDLGKDTPAFLG